MKNTQKQFLAIYTRVSRKEQAVDGLSLDNQLYRGKQLATKLAIGYRVYTDAGRSGELPVAKRPALQQMFKDIAVGNVTAVYAFKQSRLSRNKLIEWLSIVQFLKDNNKPRLFYGAGEEQKYLDSKTEMIMNIVSSVDHQHNQEVREYIKSVGEKRIIDGKAPAGRILAYGYDKDPKGYLLIHPEESKVMKLMFELANTGYSVVSICKYLNNLGHKTKVGKDFAPRFVYEKLTNPMYKGVLMYGDNGKKPGHTYDKKPYPCPAIVSAELFDTVQEQLKSRNTFKDTTNNEYFILKGLLYCGVCGKGFYIHKPRTGKTELNTYQCSSGQTKASCGNRGLYVASLDKIITDNVHRLVEIVEEAFSNETLQYRSHTMRKQMKEAKIKLDTLKKEKQNLVQAIIKDWVKEEDKDIEKQMDSFNSDIETTEVLYNDSLKELGIVEHKDEILDICRQGVMKFKKMKDNKDKIDFLRSVISKVVILYVGKPFFRANIGAKKTDSNSVDIEPSFDIFINFKINQLEKYLIIKNVNFKQPLFRNDSYKNPTILKEKISLEYHISIDESENVMTTQPYISYDNFYDKAFPDSATPTPKPNKR